MMSTRKHALAAVSAMLGGLIVFAGCGGGAGSTVTGPNGRQSVDNGFTVGILLPESRTARYETFDKPYMEAKVKQLCPRCQVLYQNADQDAGKQQSQAAAMLAQGAKVLILDPVHAMDAGGIVQDAQKRGVPVVSYDRLAEGPISFYVSFNNFNVGEVQGQALLDALTAGGDPKRGDIVMINGAPTDPNSAEFKAGAHSVLDGRVNIGQETDTPGWSPDEARREMERAITKLGKDRIIGVYAANDGTAGGAIAAMQANGFTTIPPTTGQDAELAAVQRILMDEQYMTVYKAIKPEAETAASMAVAAATGQQYAGQPTVRINNGTTDVVAVLLKPVPVVKTNIMDTVVKDGLYTREQICTPELAQACREAGVT